MIKSLPEYLIRGGTKTAIAEAWGVSLQYVSTLTSVEPENYMVDYNPHNPKRVNAFYTKERMVKAPSKVFFDAGGEG